MKRLCLAFYRSPEQVSVHSSRASRASDSPGFVALGRTVGSTTSFVSVFIPLALDPGNSVGVRTKIFPLRCRGSIPPGGYLLAATINVCAFRET